MCYITKYYICVQFWYKMTEEERKLLGSFEGKMQHLMYLYRNLKKENQRLVQLLAEKEKEILKVQDECLVLKDNYTNLKQARIISANDNELKDTRQRLSRLVREVDKCIALLNE